ncbi:M60 family metallopeptidase [Pedobacter sp. MW01-1-1]|uniref:M60 family metallopeptidase n=1 Tax=Pedobacter sp. MW01-1-1 TaxID=3383027 RepID=UPI003FEDC4D8
MKKRLMLASGVMLCFGLLNGCKKSNSSEESTTSTFSTKNRNLAVNSNPNLLTTVGTNVQEFNELKDAAQETTRLRIKEHHWTDFDPTGFYVPANTTLNITVDQLAGSNLPKLIIGTYYRYRGTQNNGVPTIVQLTAGVNTINSGTYGGILWVRYTTTGTPSSSARLTFNSGHVKVPMFIKNQTTPTDWSNQLTTYTTPDVLLIGDYVYQVYARTRAINYLPQDNNFVLSIADSVWKGQSDYSGIDNSAAQHMDNVHNRMLVCETDYSTGTGGAYADHYAVYFKPSNIANAFTPAIATGWGMWHEFGHQHQSNNWTWNGLEEVTVNVYSLYSERMLGITPSRLKTDNRWPAILSYVNNPSTTKNYNSGPDAWVRLGMFQQLWLAYGDSFFTTLDKKARNEPYLTQTPTTKMRWFLLSASIIAGENLGPFFKKWGIPVTASVYTEVDNLGLPAPAVDPSTLSE